MTAARLVASGCGAGFLPWAPGTWGSLLALVAGTGLLAASPWLLAACVVLATVAGLWAISHAGGAADPGWVVIDEVAGMWLTMLPLAVQPHPAWPWFALAFAVFRVLDITKPGPIGVIDRHPGAVGVMGDDLVAGCAGAAVIAALRWALPTL